MDNNENYFKNKMNKFSQSSFRLTDVTDLSNGEHPAILMDLIPMYESINFIETAVASILNSILTHKRAVFLKSTNDLKALIVNDPNRKTKRTDLSSKEICRVVAVLRDQFVYEIAPGISSPNVPGIWKVTDERILEYLTQVYEKGIQEIIELQGEPLIEWRTEVESRFPKEEFGRRSWTDKKPNTFNRVQSNPLNDDQKGDDNDEPPPKKPGFRRERKRF
jgi:hypothetical protein